MKKTAIRKDPLKGRGVFAIEGFKRGELVECCELILMDLKEVRDTLEGYVYQYSKNKAAVALGNGSLFNHSKKANCEFYFHYAKKLLYVRAKKLIPPGQEITINYGYDTALKERFKIRE